jgi:flagellin
MALALNTNVSSLNAQNSLNKTNMNLSKSLERLSTGLKINRGADGPAALVISEKMRAQISGLRTALDNTNKAVAMVQVGEGALNEMNTLLNKARSLVLDSANGGVNDAKAFAANQAELDNIIASIDNIANRTEFNGKKLLNAAATFTFQTGANASDTADLALSDVRSSAIGGATKLDTIKTGGLGEVNSAARATAALSIIDTAIGEVTDLRGKMGAFQANNLESNANTLRNTMENTVAAESVIRDTDFAKETSNFTKYQVLVQAGTTVLSSANQTAQLVLGLLRS